MTETRAPLGALRLNNGRVRLPGSCTEEESYPYPVILRYVPGAWAENVTRGDRSVAGAYVQCAKEMEQAGCAAVVTTCGFTSLFQAEMAAAVSIPVATSSLLLVPMVLATLPAGAKLAILTYDATRLSPAHCEAAGWSLAENPVVIGGVEGSESWTVMSERQSDVTHAMLLRDVSAALEKVRAAHPEVRAVVFECAVFPIVTPDIRARMGLPVYDYMTLANYVMAATATGLPSARAAAE